MESTFFPPAKRPLTAAADPTNLNGTEVSNKHLKPLPPLLVPTGHVFFRFLCHSSRVSGVIGRGGAAIKQLQSETGSKIRIEDSLPGSDDRVIFIVAPSTLCKKLRLGEQSSDGGGGGEEYTVSAAQEALVRVFERVLDVAAAADEVAAADLGGGTLSCRLLAEASQAGSVIGKGGKVVERIRRETGCKIRVLVGDKLPVGVAEGDEIVEIEGDILSIKKALLAVSSCLQECPVQMDKSKMSSRPSEFSSKASLRHLPPDILPMQTSVLPTISRSLINRSLDVQSSADEFERGSSMDLKAEKQVIIFKILCASDRIGSVIGKGGSVIKALQEETGVAISIGPSVAGCDEQLVIITSMETPESYYSPAQHATVRFFARSVEAGMEKRVEASSSKSSSVTARLVVPESQVGCLIGKGGATVSELRKSSGAKIHIIGGNQVPKCASDKDEVVEISGEISNVKDALYQVTGRLRDNLFPSKMTSSAAPKAHSWSIFETSIAGSRTRSSSIFETNVGRPRTSSLLMYDTDIQDTVRNSISSSSMYGLEIYDIARSRMIPSSIYDSNNPTVSGNRMTLSSVYDTDIPDAMGCGTDSLSMYETNLNGRPREHASTMLHQSVISSQLFGRQSDITERRDYPGIPYDRGLSPSSRLWTSQVAGNRRSFLDIDRDLPSASFSHELGRERISAVVTNTSMEILVPEDVVTSLYGDSGGNLARLRQISGAKIEVCEALPGVRDRTIVVSGTPDQTQVAQSLLNAFILNGPL